MERIFVCPICGNMLEEDSGSIFEGIGHALAKLPEAERPERVVMVITTDGMENASHEYTADQVRAMITHQKEKYSWEFLFLGANIDAVQTAARFGIGADRSVTFHSDHQGTQLNYEALSDSITAFRACAAIPKNWSERIQKDHANRKKEE